MPLWLLLHLVALPPPTRHLARSLPIGRERDAGIDWYGNRPPPRCLASVWLVRP